MNSISINKINQIRIRIDKEFDANNPYLSESVLKELVKHKDKIYRNDDGTLLCCDVNFLLNSIISLVRASASQVFEEILEE